MKNTKTDIECPSCKNHNWIELDKGYFCSNCEENINKLKQQIDKKYLKKLKKSLRDYPMIKKTLEISIFP